MTQALTTVPFFFEGQEVRTVKIDGEAHFVGIDVATRLGYADPGKAIRRHCRGGGETPPHR